MYIYREREREWERERLAGAYYELRKRKRWATIENYDQFRRRLDLPLHEQKQQCLVKTPANKKEDLGATRKILPSILSEAQSPGGFVVVHKSIDSLIQIYTESFRNAIVMVAMAFRSDYEGRGLLREGVRAGYPTDDHPPHKQTPQRVSFIRGGGCGRGGYY